MRFWLCFLLLASCSTSSADECADPQPRCDDGPNGVDGVFCCTQATACNVCFGDAFTPTACLSGEWRCGTGYILLAQCGSTWSPYADAGPFPMCDGG